MVVVIPSVPSSPHRAAAIAAARRDGAARVVVVLDGAGHEPLADQVVAHPPGRGFAAMANAGIEAAFARGAERVLLLNDDAAPEIGCIPALRDALGDGAPLVLSPVVLDWNSGAIQQRGLRVTRWSGRVRAELRVRPGAVTQDLVLAGTALAFHRATWARVGPFDTRYHFYFEDVQWSLRALARGHRLRVEEHARVRHRGGGTRALASPAAAFHLGRSHVQLAGDLGGPLAARALRLLCTAAFDLSWIARHGDPAQLTAWASGAAAALRAPPSSHSGDEGRPSPSQGPPAQPALGHQPPMAAGPDPAR